MRLQRIQDYLKRKEIDYRYSENDDCGGIEFIVRGLAYHIWEYPPEEPGCASNVRNWGRMEDFEGDYEEEIIAVMESW
ncbi:MAG: kinase [Oscillospiraceae bacterium]|nr:kinase [Oscillospiraceae bacterium]